MPSTYPEHDTGVFVFADREPYFQETLLQAIWNEGWLRRELVDARGAPLQVVHPGLWNVAAGPDFHDATVIVGGVTRRGPVEVHGAPADWLHHGHDRDPAYAQVALHVVWHNPQGLREFPPGVPLLVLAQQLSRPIEDLLSELDLAAYPYARKVGPDRWAAQLAALDDAQVADLLQACGLARLLGKARTLAAAIARDGLEQAVYTALFDALGYRHNRAAFVRLAGLAPAAELAALPPPTALAVLFGTAGLLPDPTRDPVLPAHRDWLRALWREWGPRQGAHQDWQWLRQGRPLNSPERRLLAAWCLLSRCQWRLGAALLAALHGHPTPAATLAALDRVLLVDEPAWGTFLTFGRAARQPAALLGAPRARDLVINLALPLALAEARRAGHPPDGAPLKSLLAAVPKLQDNRRFTEAAHQLLAPPSRARAVVRNAAAQQGLLKVHEDFLRARENALSS